MYLSPFVNIYQPWPSLRNQIKLPLQVLILCLQMPLPCWRLSCQPPQQQSPFGDFHIPYPFFVPFFHQPQNIQPLFHSKLPYPYLIPLINYPLYTPSIFLSDPQVFKLFLQLPSKIAFYVTMIPFPSFISPFSYPKQTPSSEGYTLKFGFLTSFFIENLSLRGQQLLRQGTYQSSSGITNRPFFFRYINFVGLLSLFQLCFILSDFALEVYLFLSE